MVVSQDSAPGARAKTADGLLRHFSDAPGLHLGWADDLSAESGGEKISGGQSEGQSRFTTTLPSFSPCFGLALCFANGPALMACNENPARTNPAGDQGDA